jgi:hypothetical protein
MPAQSWKAPRGPRNLFPPGKKANLFAPGGFVAATTCVVAVADLLEVFPMSMSEVSYGLPL